MFDLVTFFRLVPWTSYHKKIFNYSILLNTNKAKKILKWQPKYSGIKGFKQAIYETVEWYKKSKNLKKFDPSQFNI